MDRAELTLLIERFDVGEYVSDKVERSEGEDEVRLICPRCQRDHLSVNIDTGYWRCFTCEEYSHDVTGDRTLIKGAGRGLQLVEWLEGTTFKDSLAKMKEFTRDIEGSITELPRPKFANKKDIKDNLQNVNLPAECVAVDPHLPYIVRRGISPQDVLDFGIGYCATGRYANRIVFPVWEGGQCIYWQARACWDRHEHVPKHPYDKFRKTLNPKRKVENTFYLGSGDVLLNLEQAAQYKRIAITEGPTSCIRTGKDAVATFGKQLTSAQIARLISAGVEAIDFMWDGPSENEPEGTYASMVLHAQSLTPHFEVRIVALPKGDPGEYPREHLNWYRSNSPLIQANRSLQI